MQWVSQKVPIGGRVICFSDVHGNRAALDAVLSESGIEHASRVVVHGDVVSRGPCSDLTWDMVQNRADERWVIVSGNHERYVVNHLNPEESPSGLLAEVHSMSSWTFKQLGDRVADLAALPDGCILKAQGLPDVRVVHASMLGDDKGVSPESPETFQYEAAAGSWAALVVGHVHQRYDFYVGQTRVVNAGSVGSSCDGVQRAGWIELCATSAGWKIQLHRVRYDLELAEKDFHTSGFLTDAGPVAHIVHREWQLARPLVRRWFDESLEDVLSGAVPLKDSVRDFLAQV